MEKDPQKIVEQITELLSELAVLAGASTVSNQEKLYKFVPSTKKDMPGATGGVRLLIEAGKLDSPKQLLEIMEFLRQEGRHYSRQTISMGLLNLVRERVLTRFRDKEDKNWKYVIRR